MEQKRTKKIRKDDEVYLLSGNYKGQIGKVLRIVGEKAVVQGINLRKRHMKSGAGQKGGIITVEKPLPLCKMALAVEGKPAKAKMVVGPDGHKEIHVRPKGAAIWQFYRKI